MTIRNFTPRYVLGFMLMQTTLLFAEQSAYQTTETAYFDKNGNLVLGAPQIQNTAPPSFLQTAEIVEQPILASIDVAPASPELFALLNGGSEYITFQGLSNPIRSAQTVKQLYIENNFNLLWSDSEVITPLAGSLINAVLNAWKHALKPDTYHASAISSLSAGQAVAEPEKFDIIMSDAFLTYKKHLANGIVNPQEQFNTWNQQPELINPLSLVQQAQSQNSVAAVLTVNNADYQVLQKMYETLITGQIEQNQDKRPNIVAKSLKPGDKNPSVIALRQILGLPVNNDLYDKTVKAAVKHYQRDNGLDADGIAGPRTIDNINEESQSSHHDENKLVLNMERLRWQDATPEGSYVWINIPAFKMAIRRDNEYLFESNTIVGRTKRPTPIFKDTLEHVVLAPYWNVPSTIFEKDKLPKLIRNPNAFGSNMQVIDKATGRVVNASSVNWSNRGEGYRLRQLPGSRNALGRMKFLFPNRHAIYMHDTPNRRLFKRSKRAFSSGCVRLERAEDLAVFLLKDMGFDRNRVKRVSRQRKERWVSLDNSQQYPVYLNYFTAWPDKNGKVRYSRDIYGYDKPLRRLYDEALNKL